jgi:L-aminopeptidase/D-esterase-like protein
MTDPNVLSRLGVKIGHYTDDKNITGLTAFIFEQGACVGIDIRGSDTGTLNTAAFEPKAIDKLVHGIVFSGGSTYGLESAFGVMRYLEEHHIGAEIPGITGAVIYDMRVGNRNIRPTRENGYAAANNASLTTYDQGNVGVGTGATTGKWIGGIHRKGGFGIGVSTIKNQDIVVGAFVVTNAIGDVLSTMKDPQKSVDSWDYDLTKMNGLLSTYQPNTTLAVIATNVQLGKTQLMKIAESTHDGLARAISPIHTNLDGDIVFAVSSLSGEYKNIKDVKGSTLVDAVGFAASEAIVKGIHNGISSAKGVKDFPSYSGK